MKILNTLLISLLAYSASAQVGIGTSTPSVPLDIEAANAAIDINSIVADPLIHFQILSNTKFTIGVDSTDSKFKIGTTALETGTAVTVQSTGEVGIGTTSPTEQLHVSGSVLAESSSYVDVTANQTDAAMISMGVTSATTNGFINVVNTEGGHLGADPEFKVLLNSSVKFSIDGDGNVGIGIASPSTNLHIFNEAASTNSVLDILTITAESSGTPAAGIGAGIVFEIEDGTTVSEEQGRINVELDDVSNGSEDATMTFDINQNGTMTEVMRIDGTAGNVGIGTTSPTEKLHISGSVLAESSSYVDVRVNQTDAAMIHMGVSSASTNGFINVVNTEGGHLGTDPEFKILLNSSVKFRIDGDGNVGIGRAPTTNILEVEGAASKTSSGDWLANSDARLKKEIKQMDSQTVLDKMLALKGVTYYWNDTVTGSKRPTQLQYGFTAQNIQEVFPILVEEDNLGYLQTAYGTYDAMYVESMRALQEQIDSQQMIIEAQKAEIATEKVENESQKQEIETIKAEASSAKIISTETAQKLATLEAKLNALLLLNSKSAVLTAEN